MNTIRLSPIAVLFLSFSALAATKSSSPLDQALNALNSHRDDAHLSVGDSFIKRDLIIDEDGSKHVRMDRTHQNLPVIGGDLVVHLDPKGEWKGISQTLQHSVDIDLNPTVAKDEAIRVAEAKFEGTKNADSSAALVVYARGEYPVLAWDVTVNGVQLDETPSNEHFIVDAQSHQIIDKWDDIKKSLAVGTGKTLYAQDVTLYSELTSGLYYTIDSSRGGHYVCSYVKSTGGCNVFYDSDNIWGNNTTSDPETTASDASYGQRLTWDYYLSMFNRKGIANDGVGGFSRMIPVGYSNAFWNSTCFCMTYGAGDGVTYWPLVSIDVAAHEMTHGITSSTANLTYSGESGGLNEAMSDIFGTLVEYYANNAKEIPNYLIGERILVANTNINYPTTALRYMHKPSIDGLSPDCYSSTIGTLDVHYSSGVANHFFYLLTNGAVAPTGFTQTPAQLVCNGNTSLTPINRTAAARIMYRALTVYMTSSTDYAGARAATLQAAAYFYGTSGTGYNSVAAAWSAVGVN